MSGHKAFTSIKVGDLLLQHRVVLAPLTRYRNEKDTRIPLALGEEYYEQRASQGGLLISEATLIAEDAGHYARAPGIYSPAQVDAWKRVTTRVHNKGGYIFNQIWHIGRAAQSSFLGKQPVSSSDIPISGDTQNKAGEKVPYDVPRPLTVAEIKDLVHTYKTAAENSQKAGFDGVEIHAANGYLPDQFIQDGVNKRTDQYGGSAENRARFLLEIVESVSEVFGQTRVGIRFSPWSVFQSMSDSDPIATYSYILKALHERFPELAYVHFVDPKSSASAENKEKPEVDLSHFREVWKGVFLSTGGHTPESGLAKVENGNVDLVGYGKYFISNPDLPKRLELGVALTPFDFKTFYGGEEKGYVDYPTHQPTPISVTVSSL